jgi:hypothetical protein
MNTSRIIRVAAMFCGVILLLSVCFQAAIAGDVKPTNTSTPTGDTKEEITEVYRRSEKYCTIYRLTIDVNQYIVNTCGGIVLVP